MLHLGVNNGIGTKSKQNNIFLEIPKLPSTIIGVQETHFNLGTPVFTHYTSARLRYAPHDIRQ